MRTCSEHSEILQCAQCPVESIGIWFSNIRFRFLKILAKRFREQSLSLILADDIANYKCYYGIVYNSKMLPQNPPFSCWQMWAEFAFVNTAHATFFFKALMRVLHVSGHRGSLFSAAQVERQPLLYHHDISNAFSSLSLPKSLQLCPIFRSPPNP